MSKKESSFVNMLLTLFIISLVASTALGFVYEVTKAPIAQSKLQKKVSAITEVVPEFNNNPYEEAYKIAVDGDSLTLYPAKKDNALVGTAIETFTNKGFGGEIKIMVGFTADGTIYSTSVIEHHETPGLGDKIDKSKGTFSIQFEGKNPKDFKLQVKKDGGNVDAITASTISSRAFCDAIQKAEKALNTKAN